MMPVLPDGHDVIQFEKAGPLNDKSDGDTLIIRLSLFTPSDQESAHPRSKSSPFRSPSLTQMLLRQVRGERYPN